MIDIQGFEVFGILKKGQQIICRPDHLSWVNVSLPTPQYWNPQGFQPGFVTSGPAHRDAGDEPSYFCRYWQFDYKKQIYVPFLRTVANSELTSSRNIIIHDTFLQMHIDFLVETMAL